MLLWSTNRSIIYKFEKYFILKHNNAQRLVHNRHIKISVTGIFHSANTTNPHTKDGKYYVINDGDDGNALHMMMLMMTPWIPHEANIEGGLGYRARAMNMGKFFIPIDVTVVAVCFMCLYVFFPLRTPCAVQCLYVWLCDVCSYLYTTYSVL